MIYVKLDRVYNPKLQVTIEHKVTDIGGII